MYIEGAWQIITLSSSDIKHTDLTIKLFLLHNYIPISASELHSMAVQVDFRDISSRWNKMAMMQGWLLRKRAVNVPQYY